MEKDRLYYANARTEMLNFIPRQTEALVLEVGCSNGEFGAALKYRFGYIVWGIEPDYDAASHAASQLDRVFAAPIEQAELPSGIVFDGMVLNDVLEHLPDASRVLKTLRDLLKPGGWVVAGDLFSEGVFTVSAAMLSLTPFYIHFHEEQAVGFHVTDALSGDSARGALVGEFPGAIRPRLDWRTARVADR